MLNHSSFCSPVLVMPGATGVAFLPPPPRITVLLAVAGFCDGAYPLRLIFLEALRLELLML